MTEFVYEIKQHIATISDNENGETKELNLISYKNKPPKYDLRTWKTDGEERKMFKGITFTIDELHYLKEALNNMPELS